jgi:hypothetical protein
MSGGEVDRGLSGAMTTGRSVMYRRTGIASGSAPSAMDFSRSRSVMMPTSS